MTPAIAGLKVQLVAKSANWDIHSDRGPFALRQCYRLPYWTLWIYVASRLRVDATTETITSPSSTNLTFPSVLPYAAVHRNRAESHSRLISHRRHDRAVGIERALIQIDGGTPTLLPIASLPLPSILLLRVLARLPLHIRRSVSTAACERLDVINDIPRARTFRLARCRAWVLPSKLSTRG